MLDPRLVEAFSAENGFPLEKHLVVLGLVGSHSHGTYIPPTEPDAIDDVDLMGFVIPPVEYHLGLPRWDHWVWKFEELDVVLYSLDKAVRLLLKGNPNIMGMLWLQPEHYLHGSRTFNLLQMNRQLFSSLEVAEAFSGYAYAQFKKMEAFDLDRMDEYEKLTSMITCHGPLSEVLEADDNKLRHLAEHWDIEQQILTRFRKIHRQHFSGYMGAKRKSMVRKYNYDVKNAAHLIRLLRMGLEFLTTGRLQVFRTEDAEQLRDIKQGKWTLADVKEEAEALFDRFEWAKQTSALATSPNEPEVNKMLIDLHRKVLLGGPV